MKTLRLFTAALALMVAGSAMAQSQANPSATPQKETKQTPAAAKPAATTTQTPAATPASAKKADPTMTTTAPGQGGNAAAKQEKHQAGDKMMAEHAGGERHAGGEKHAVGTKHMKGSKARVKKETMQKGNPDAQPVK
jgi:hypothetical protein